MKTSNFYASNMSNPLYKEGYMAAVHDRTLAAQRFSELSSEEQWQESQRLSDKARHKDIELYRRSCQLRKWLGKVEEVVALLIAASGGLLAISGLGRAIFHTFQVQMAMETLQWMAVFTVIVSVVAMFVVKNSIRRQMALPSYELGYAVGKKDYIDNPRKIRHFQKNPLEEWLDL